LEGLFFLLNESPQGVHLVVGVLICLLKSRQHH
jgi:hypothetical protein